MWTVETDADFLAMLFDLIGKGFRRNENVRNVRRVARENFLYLSN